MPDVDATRLAKLLELASHPSSNDGEALNSLRAARGLLARSGRSLAELVAGERTLLQPRSRSDAGPQDLDAEALRRELRTIAAERDRLRSENARLRRENRRIESLKAELDAFREAGAAAFADPAPSLDPEDAPAPITANLIAVFDLLSEWRSIADLVEKLDSGLGQTGVKRLVRMLDSKGLLRAVESWPTRYRLRFEGELSDVAKAFRAHIEDARLAG